jgi:RHS repeat-associated protein
MNKLIQVQMTRNGTTQTRTFNYDQGGQGVMLLSAINPENGTVTYTYNADATLASRRDAKNQTVNYSYDGYKRLTQVLRPDGTQDNYSYDTQPYGASVNTQGRLAAVTFAGRPDPNTNAATAFANIYNYNAAGQVTAKRLQITRGSLQPTVLEADYNYDNEGHPTSVTYPTTANNGQGIGGPGPTYSYTYDSMGRLYSMAQTNGPLFNNSQNLPVTFVQSTSYGVANELLSIAGNANAGYNGETRSYNSLFQLTQVTANSNLSALVNMQYTYPDGANIGKITKQKNWISGEEVQYQYDSLGRMITAQTTASSQGSAWGYSYSYDGFGNLLAKNVTQGNPSAGWSGGADPATNRAGGGNYDANGNMTSNPLGQMTYDVENRLTSVSGENYGYDPSNKRIQKQLTNGVEEIHFYGAAGERLGIYNLQINGSSVSCGMSSLNIYFGGKRIGRVYSYGNTGFVGLDRLGSDGGLNSYPWGEEKTTTTQNTDKYATYYRDGTGLDYADQRYYSSIMGRFLTPDPAMEGVASLIGTQNQSFENMDLENPQSWNLYAYVEGDPVNFSDPTGLVKSYCQEHPLSPDCPDGISTKDDLPPARRPKELPPPQEGPGIVGPKIVWTPPKQPKTKTTSTKTSQTDPCTRGFYVFGGDIIPLFKLPVVGKIGFEALALVGWDREKGFFHGGIGAATIGHVAIGVDATRYWKGWQEELTPIGIGGYENEPPEVGDGGGNGRRPGVGEIGAGGFVTRGAQGIWGSIGSFGGGFYGNLFGGSCQ